MAFKKLFPRKGTVIPEGHRPEGSINAALHGLPAYREHTHDLVGALLFLPRTGWVVTPFRLSGSGDADCAIVMGDKRYPRGGHHVNVCRWELQRAEHVVFTLQTLGEQDCWAARRTAEGRAIRVVAEQPIEVQPDPVCIRCGVWLTAPGKGVNYIDTPAGPECLAVIECADRQAKDSRVYRAPVQS